MTKLHELLAVEQNLRGQADVTRKDLMNTFEKKRTHFFAVKSSFQSEVEDVESADEEQFGMESTIPDELKWISEKITGAMDVSFQIDVANTSAKADVIMSDGSVLLKDVPATSLLQLEKRLAEIQELIRRIPTQDPAKGFEPDISMGKYIYKAREVRKPRTRKEFSFIVMVPPTEKHPAQVKELSLDKKIGMLLVQEWTSLIDSATKSGLLDRVEEVTRAVKKARSRANEQEIDTAKTKIGSKIFDYILKPVI